MKKGSISDYLQLNFATELGLFGWCFQLGSKVVFEALVTAFHGVFLVEFKSCFND